MKDLMTKLKTLDYKQFAIQHGEKIGMGVVGIVVLACLAMTNWASEYTRSPREMIEKAEDTDRKLKQNVWPDTEKTKFIPPLAADRELALLLAPVESSRFGWSKPLSPKLHPRQLPADEPVVQTAIELRAFADRGAIGVPLPPVDVAEEEPEQPRGKPARGKGKKGDDDGALPLLRPGGGGMDAALMGGYGSAGEKTKGMRFVVVTGAVDVQKQYGLLMNSLHVGSKPEAAAQLEYVDFKIQRQRAVPGPNPWTGEWVDVAKDNSIEILSNEVSDFDAEVVPTANTHQVFTSPLPRRVDDEWDPELVAHPRIPTLTEEQQEFELMKNKAALENAGDDEEDAGARRGFARVQRDAKRVQSRAMGMDSGRGMMDSMTKMMQGKQEGMQKAQQDMMRNMMGGMMGGNMNMTGQGNMAGNRGSVDAGADYLLFRFFDFDVEPGECYRYRVQLVILNPSFNESFVSAPTVAEGELRQSGWSEPSTPAVVDRDVEYALSKVDRRTPRAELSVVQFDNQNGTFLSDSFPVQPGAYVAAVKKSLHLDVGEPKFAEETVTFTSKDVLLDAVAAPELSEGFKKDLGLDQKALRELNKAGKLDMAVTLNRFGEIVELDAGSKDALQSALKKVEEEREPYKDLKESGKKKKDDDLLSAYGAPDDKASRKKKKKRDKADNPLRMSGMGMMMPGMMGAGGAGGMMHAPPSGGGKGKK